MDKAAPIYERIDDLKAIQENLRKAGVTADHLFVATTDHPSEAVQRRLKGGILPGVRSGRDAVEQLRNAIAKGEKGIDPSNL